MSEHTIFRIANKPIRFRGQLLGGSSICDEDDTGAYTRVRLFKTDGGSYIWAWDLSPAGEIGTRRLLATLDGVGDVDPQVDGQLLRIPIPELNEERRKEMVKLAGKYAEQARIAVRNVRRDGMDQLKKLEKDHVIGEDEHRDLADELQKLTDNHVGEIDKILQSKDQEIMQV